VTQTAIDPAAVLPTPSGPATRVIVRWRAVRRDVRGTPGRMRAMSAALIALGLLMALGGAQAFSTAQGALTRADADAAQLVRLQLIRTSLVRADADATNAFLVGGLEPVDQRRDYDQAVQRAGQQLAYAARAQPADGDPLARLNIALQDYTGLVQQARANNRQNLPVGAQYLRQASAGLRADALPLLENLTTANQERARQEFSLARAAIAWLLVAALPTLALLVLALVWLARRTHRYLNLPLAGAAGLTVIALLVGLIVLGSVATAVSDIRDGPYAASRALADARVSAFDAKSNESLTLVSRGSGAAFETTWQGAARDVDADLRAGAGAGSRTDPRISEAGTSWSRYRGLHVGIRALDDERGDWDGAVKAATSPAPGGVNKTFATFDAASDAALTSASRDTTGQLRDAGSALTLATWWAVLAGLAVAALAWWGLTQRIEEYR
jgi:hypothetical protein